MSEADVANLAKPILKSQTKDEKSWGNEDHAILLANIAVEHGLPPTMKNKFIKALTISGQGAANHSQFRQWMEKKLGVKFKAKSNKLFTEF